jgi:hypothetical protein
MGLLTVPPLQISEISRLNLPRCDINDAALVPLSEFEEHFVNQIHRLELAGLQKRCYRHEIYFNDLRKGFERHHMERSATIDSSIVYKNVDFPKTFLCSTY